MCIRDSGEIVLNLNYSATKDLHIDNDAIVLSARFGGISQNLYVPMSAVKGVFARENGQGMFFETSAQIDSDGTDTNAKSVKPLSGIGSEAADDKVPAKKKPNLTIVKLSLIHISGVARRSLLLASKNDGFNFYCGMTLTCSHFIYPVSYTHLSP